MNIITELLEEKQSELKRTDYLINECEEHIQKDGSNTAIFEAWNNKKQFFIPVKEKIERQIKELETLKNKL